MLPPANAVELAAAINANTPNTCLRDALFFICLFGYVVVRLGLVVKGCSYCALKKSEYGITDLIALLLLSVVLSTKRVVTAYLKKE